MIVKNYRRLKQAGILKIETIDKEVVMTERRTTNQGEALDTVTRLVNIKDLNRRKKILTDELAEIEQIKKDYLLNKNYK